MMKCRQELERKVRVSADVKYIWLRRDRNSIIRWNGWHCQYRECQSANGWKECQGGTQTDRQAGWEGSRERRPPPPPPDKFPDIWSFLLGRRGEGGSEDECIMARENGIEVTSLHAAFGTTENLDTPFMSIFQPGENVAVPSFKSWLLFRKCKVIQALVPLIILFVSSSFSDI